MLYRRRQALLLVGSLWLGLAAAPDLRARRAAAQSSTPAYDVLVFSRTAGFRHESIPDAIQAVRDLGDQHGFRVQASEDPTVFSDAGLAPFNAVMFLMTTGHVLDDSQQAALERFIRAGRGFIGVHSAADTEYDWPWYGGLVGAYFASHPDIQPAIVRVENARDVSTAGLPAAWPRVDEWYNFRSNPRENPDIQVLASLDETTYAGGVMGDHPIAWSHAYDGGRAWYTAGGHTRESYAEPLFVQHLLGGIEYAATGVSEPQQGS